MITVNGKNYKVIEPTIVMNNEASKIYVQELSKALKSGNYVPRDNLTSYLMANKMIPSDFEDKLKDLQSKIQDKLQPLKIGGIRLSDMAARAKEAQKMRQEVLRMTNTRASYDSLTAESVAENAQFQFFLFSCLRNEDGSLVFKNASEFESCQDTDLLTEAAKQLNKILYKIEGDDNWYKKLPENEFLIKYKFMSEDYKFLDEKEQEFQPFLDDNDQPVIVE